jgi:hypothetical protein
MTDLSNYIGNNGLLIQRLLFFLFDSINNAFSKYTKEKSYSNYIIFKNNIIYFMLICLNLKNNKKFGYFLIKEKIEYLNSLITDIQKLDEKDNIKKRMFNDILYNLFSKEYINLGLIDENEKIKIKSKKILINFYKTQKKLEKNIEIEDKKYRKIIELLFNFDSDNFLNFDIKSFKTLDIDENFYHQLETVKSILLIVFSKEKYKYLNNEKENEIFYEFDFLNKVIIKNFKDTKQLNGDKYKTLFRKENITNDIIKDLFFIFGNKLIIECLVKPLDKVLNITGINNEFEIITKKGKSLNMERDITKDEFDLLFDKILEKLTENIPQILKIFLKMIYDNVLEIFTIEKDNYIPLGVALIFNYIASPRIQKIFFNQPHKYVFIKSMNKLLCNTCFNIEFSEKDPLKIFNKEINVYHEKLNKFFEKNILNVDVNDIENKKFLKNIFSKLNVEIPSFLFNLECDYLQMLVMLEDNKKE